MNNLDKFGLPTGLGMPSAVSSRPAGIYEVPTDFVDLPSQGKFYPKESPLFGVEKLEIKYMTTKEEDLLVSPGLQKAGIAVDRVIESLLVDKRIRAKDLLVGDKNAILINARKNAFGDEYDFYYNCQKCGAQNKHTENFNNVKIKEITPHESCSITESGTIMMRLPKSSAMVELKFLRGEDEATIDQIIQKREANNLPAEALVTRYRYMIVSVNGNNDIEAIVSFINTMPILDSMFLRTRYAEINPNIEFNYNTECKKCGSNNEGGVPITANFFWPEL